jgi:hypothetical protein
MFDCIVTAGRSDGGGNVEAVLSAQRFAHVHGRVFCGSTVLTFGWYSHTTPACRSVLYKVRNGVQGLNFGDIFG